MGSEDQIVALVDGAAREHGRLDILVNNAGIYPTAKVLDMQAAQWDLVLDIDLRAPFIAAREAARRMKEMQIAGKIVNISSMNAFRSPRAGVAHYDAAKAGINALTRSLAIEVGRYGIRVNSVAPGLNVTEGQREAFGLAPDESADAYPRFFKEWIQHTPLQRPGTPDDQARVVLFLVSDAAAYITGQCIIVDGGAMLV
jgi:3-oxoacyl-[acyl-carrier protein] reductase